MTAQDSTAEFKVCTKCGEAKAVTEFYSRKSRPSGVTSSCKVCCRKAKALSRSADPEASRVYQRAMYAKHAEKRRQEKRDSFALNPDKQREINRKSREKHKEKRLAETRAWHAANKEQQNRASRAYYRANATRLKALIHARKKERMKSDPMFAMAERVRSLIYSRIRAGGYTKKSRSGEILGCSWDFFKAHIERQFLKGMTWDNRSEWHIDHIVPISSAKTEEDVIRLNHFTNLRPMWAKDNIAKSDRITHLI